MSAVSQTSRNNHILTHLMLGGIALDQDEEMHLTLTGRSHNDNGRGHTCGEGSMGGGVATVEHNGQTR